MKTMIGIWFVAVSLLLAILLCLYDDLQRGGPTEHTCTSVHPETAVEIWTDPKTGHRFAVSYRRWRDGVGICLIPEREEENDCPVPALAEKVILESTVGWKEIQ